tara:strand:- start:114 stop:884 length:771 start_codon:yes stop_codon:yes gene_type:complete
MSFTDNDGLNPANFIGFDNYIKLFLDPNYIIPIKNTIIWTVLATVFPVAIGFLFAYSIQFLPRSNFFQILIYIPATVSAAAAGVLFGFILDKSGLFNQVLALIGFEHLNRDWLFRAPENTYSMIGAYTWQATGINMMIFLVGLQGLPKEPMEAAKIDGAKGFTLIFKIVIPMIMPYFVIASLLALINSFRIFDSVWVMTMGGPGRYSETLAVTMYREGFIIFDLGYAAAVAVLISLVGLVFSYYYLKSVLTKEDVS